MMSNEQKSKNSIPGENGVVAMLTSRVFGSETALGYKKAKTNRNWVQILHFYHAKTVNIDMRLLWRSVASTKAL